MVWAIGIVCMYNAVSSTHKRHVKYIANNVSYGS